MNEVVELQGYDRVLDRVARSLEWAAQEIARLRGLNTGLLEALQAMVELHYRDDYIGLAKDIQAGAQAVIAKALGEAVTA